jgi:hypothetical protein
MGVLTRSEQTAVAPPHSSNGLNSVGVDESMTEESNGELELLEGLVIDNLDLEELEGLLDQFNISRAVGVVQLPESEPARPPGLRLLPAA